MDIRNYYYDSCFLFTKYFIIGEDDQTSWRAQGSGKRNSGEGEDPWRELIADQRVISTWRSGSLQGRVELKSHAAELNLLADSTYTLLPTDTLGICKLGLVVKAYVVIDDTGQKKVRVVQA